MHPVHDLRAGLNVLSLIRRVRRRDSDGGQEAVITPRLSQGRRPAPDGCTVVTAKVALLAYPLAGRAGAPESVCCPQGPGLLLGHKVLLGCLLLDLIRTPKMRPRAKSLFAPSHVGRSVVPLLSITDGISLSVTFLKGGFCVQSRYIFSR